jgi:hypothetical protein
MIPGSTQQFAGEDCIFAIKKKKRLAIGFNTVSNCIVASIALGVPVPRATQCMKGM